SRTASRQLFQLAVESRPHRRLCLLDRVPTPTGERLRLPDDGKSARHVGLRRLRAGPTDFVEPTLSRSSAGREVDVAVGANLEVGDRHRLAMYELSEILTTGVGRAGRGQRRIEQAAAGPVGLEQVVEKG